MLLSSLYLKIIIWTPIDTPFLSVQSFPTGLVPYFHDNRDFTDDIIHMIFLCSESAVTMWGRLPEINTVSASAYNHLQQQQSTPHTLVERLSRS